MFQQNVSCIQKASLWIKVNWLKRFIQASYNNSETNKQTNKKTKQKTSHAHPFILPPYTLKNVGLSINFCHYAELVISIQVLKLCMLMVSRFGCQTARHIRLAYSLINDSIVCYRRMGTQHYHILSWFLFPTCIQISTLY